MTKAIINSKTITACCMAFALVLAGCGGRTANPVMVSQYGDMQKSCRSLEFEMQSIQSEIQRLIPDKDKTGKNVALGVTGAFFLIPLFFMDFKNAEATEYEAYRQRYNHLASVAIDKRCDVKPVAYAYHRRSIKSQKPCFNSNLCTACSGAYITGNQVRYRVHECRTLVSSRLPYCQRFLLSTREPENAGPQRTGLKPSYL